MRSIRCVSVLATLAICLGLAACGSGDDDGGAAGSVDAPIDAGMTALDAPIDGAPPTGSNALGQVCNMNTPCPAGNSCVTITGVGSQTSGYCTPNCMAMDSRCTTGYTGPAGGMPRCVLSPAMNQPANGCAIVCTGATQCPTGLTCISAGAGAPMICVPPA